FARAPRLASIVRCAAAVYLVPRRRPPSGALRRRRGDGRRSLSVDDLARLGYAAVVDRVRPAELNDEIVAKVTALCEQGDDDVEAGRYEESIARYRAALALVPHPVHMWAVSTWILGAIAEAHYLGGEYARARDAIDEAFHCEGAIGNAF